MFNILYKGLKIVVSDAAMWELIKESKTLWDVKEILENGYDSPRKRSKNIIERWSDKGNKTHQVVVVRDYNRVLR